LLDPEEERKELLVDLLEARTVDRDLLGLLEREEDLESGKEVKIRLQGSLDLLLGETRPTGLLLCV